MAKKMIQYTYCHNRPIQSIPPQTDHTITGMSDQYHVQPIPMIPSILPIPMIPRIPTIREYIVDQLPCVIAGIVCEYYMDGLQNPCTCDLLHMMRTHMPVTREISVGFTYPMLLRAHVRYGDQMLWHRDYQRYPADGIGCVALQSTYVAILLRSTTGYLEVWDWYARDLVFTTTTHSKSCLATPDHVHLVYHNPGNVMYVWNSEDHTVKRSRAQIV